MFHKVDKNGKESVTLSRLEQGRLAAINVQMIKIQNLRELNVPEKDIIEAEVELAGLRRIFGEML